MTTGSRRYSSASWRPATSAMALTVDLAVDSNRERPMLTRYVRESRRAAAYQPLFQARLTWKRWTTSRA